ncbi:MAG TPA: hypothetical protein PLA46_05150 [Phycicoccus sp.]|nr:hypothetical protein [Phycicoccus sp.]
MVESPRRPLGVSRRSVTRGLGGLALIGISSATAGCGVRLEENAPDIPFIPRRSKVAGEDLLIGLVDKTATLSALASAAAGTDPTARLLVDLHQTQVSVLQDRLRATGVPTAVLGPEPSPTFPADATTGRLREAETAAAAEAETYAGVDPSFGPLVLAMMAQRQAAALALTPTDIAPAEPSVTQPSDQAGSLLSPEALTSLGEVSYLLDVILPHAAEAEHALALATKAALQALTERGLTALHAAPPPPVLGVPHPTDIDSSESQRQAIAAALAGTVAAYGRALAGLAKTRSRDAMTTVPHELGGLVDWHRQWGGTLTPFPGLK